MPDPGRVRVEPESGHRLEEALRALLSVEPHLAYANFPPVADRGNGARGYHRTRWLRGGADAPMLVARSGQGHPLAALWITERGFESEHFGRRIAAIEAPAAVVDETARLAALRAIYAAVRPHLIERGFEHVTAQASTQDRVAWRALQESGCFHVGTRISWMARLHGTPSDHRLGEGLRIERYERDTFDRLPASSWQRLHAWTADAFDRGPFVFDMDVPLEQATSIYQVWTRKALSGQWADVLLVVRDGEEVVAFNSMMLLPELSEAAGVAIVGRGIGASLPGYRGLFTALQKECAACRPLGAQWLETETQSSTVASINVFGRLGQHCLRSTGSFHSRLDAGTVAPGA